MAFYSSLSASAASVLAEGAVEARLRLLVLDTACPVPCSEEVHSVSSVWSSVSTLIKIISMHQGESPSCSVLSSFEGNRMKDRCSACEELLLNLTTSAVNEWFLQINSMVRVR